MRRRRIALFLHRWHRRIGVSACVFILWLVSSGWLLNHSDTLHLAQTESRALPLLNWYGLKSETPTLIWSTAHHWLVASADVLVLDGNSLPVAPLQLMGVVESNDLLFVAGKSRDGISILLLLAPTGAVVDTVQGAMLPLQNIARIGSGCNGVVIDDSAQTATQRFGSDDGANWKACNEAVIWSEAKSITADQRAIVEPLLRPGISYERILLDLHSGRFFGSWGPYFVDAIGACLMLLALSGLWIFSNQRRQRRGHRRRAPH